MKFDWKKIGEKTLMGLFLWPEWNLLVNQFQIWDTRMGREIPLQENQIVRSHYEQSTEKRRKIIFGDLWRMKTSWAWRCYQRRMKEGSVWGRAEKLCPGQGMTPGCCHQQELMGNPFPWCGSKSDV